MSNFAKVQLEQIWQKTLQLINESAHFDDAVFNAWYKEDSHLFDIEDDFATIVVPYKINKQIMMDSIDLIQQKLSDVLDMKVSCQIPCSRAKWICFSHHLSLKEEMKFYLKTK